MSVRPKVESLEVRMLLSSFAVINTNDSGAGSFRQAIINANANNGNDTITFNITGTGVQTISLATPLPTVTDSVVIDGTSQPGYAGTPLIELSGASAGANTVGLTLTNKASMVEGLTIDGFGGAGIVLTGTGAFNDTIRADFIGTTTSGTAASGNLYGIEVLAGANDNLIGGSTAADRNIISGNVRSGIYLAGTGTTSNVITGNYIGVDVTGNADLGNGVGYAGTATGVFVDTGAANTVIGGLTGTTGNPVPGTGLGNVISGNHSYQILLSGGGASVEGNIIGLGADGSTVIDSTSSGIEDISSNDVIGGMDVLDRNVIGGFGTSGLILYPE